MSWFTNFFGKIFGRNNNTEIETTEEQTKNTKKALIVGINKWEYLSGSNLNGCVNDAKNIYSLLTETFSFSSKNIKMLTDYEATKAAIVEGLKWLVKNAKSGDLLVFTMSSHGTQVDDNDGDEEDGQDEAVCPTDLSYDDWDNTLLKDDELYEIIKDIPDGVELVILIDACHSGSATRELKKNGGMARFLKSINKNKGKIRRFGRANDNRKQNHVFLSGCQDDETSADAYVNGDYNGALTWSACKAARENPNYTYQEWAKRTIEIVKENGWEQNPNYLANDELNKRKIFGGK